MTRLTRLTELMNSAKNFEVYRKCFADEKGPCIPYIGILLTDLVFMSRMAPKSFAERPRLFDTPRAISLASKISSFLRFCDTPYPYQMKRPHYEFFSTGMAPPPSADLFALSLAAEPHAAADLLLDTYFSYPLLRGCERLPEMQNYSMHPRDWDALLRGVTSVDVRGGEVVLEQDSLSTKFHVIRGGTALLYKRGNQKLARQVGEGHLIGDLSMLGNLRSPVTIIAEESLILATLEISALYRLFESDKDLARRFFATVALRTSADLRAIHSDTFFTPSPAPQSPPPSLRLFLPPDLTSPSSHSLPAIVTPRQAMSPSLSPFMGPPPQSLTGSSKMKKRDVPDLFGSIGRSGGTHLFDGILPSSHSATPCNREVSEFCKKFRLPEGEEKIEEHPCYKEQGGAGASTGMDHLGTISFTDNFICHIVRMFNYEEKEVIPIERVSGVSVQQGLRLVVASADDPEATVFRYWDGERGGEG